MKECFLGGDERHEVVIVQLNNGIKKCEEKRAEAKSLGICK